MHAFSAKLKRDLLLESKRFRLFLHIFRSVVCLSVCLSACLSHLCSLSLSLSASLNHSDAIWQAHSWDPTTHFARWESMISKKKRRFGGRTTPPTKTCKRMIYDSRGCSIGQSFRFYFVQVLLYLIRLCMIL